MNTSRILRTTSIYIMARSPLDFKAPYTSPFIDVLNSIMADYYVDRMKRMFEIMEIELVLSQIAMVLQTTGHPCFGFNNTNLSS